MKLSTKGRYAITAMMDLAIHTNIGPVTLADISQCQGISLSYLEQLFAKLRKSGLVEGVRGPGGGYKLARTAEDITIMDILKAVDENAQATPMRRSRVHKQDQCLTHDLWLELSVKVQEFLGEISLAEFTNRPDIVAMAEKQNNYYSRNTSQRRNAA